MLRAGTSSAVNTQSRAPPSPLADRAAGVKLPVFGCSVARRWRTSFLFVPPTFAKDISSKAIDARKLLFRHRGNSGAGHLCLGHHHNLEAGHKTHIAHQLSPGQSLVKRRTKS